MAPTYASLKIAPAARDALQRLALNMSADAGKRLTMSDALIAAVSVAERHPDELRAALTDQKGADQ